MAPEKQDDKLNKSLEDLIAEQRSKNKGKPKAGVKVGKGKGKVAIKQQQGKQAPGKKGAPLRAPLKVQKGGVAKAAGPGKAQKRPDVRVVPRNAAPLRGPPFRGPPMGFMPPMMGMPPMMPPMMMQQQQQMRGGNAPGGRWQNDRFQGQQQQQQKPAISTAKLFISNLDFNVTDDDIKELFGTIGTLKESGIHYDKSGRSMGTAHVVFASVNHAKTAFDKYNNVALDGKRMNIEMVDAPLPPGTIKKLSSGINVQKPGQGGGGGGVRGRGHAHAGGDFMDTN